MNYSGCFSGAESNKPLWDLCPRSFMMEDWWCSGRSVELHIQLFSYWHRNLDHPTGHGHHRSLHWTPSSRSTIPLCHCALPVNVLLSLHLKTPRLNFSAQCFHNGGTTYAAASVSIFKNLSLHLKTLWKKNPKKFCTFTPFNWSSSF